MGAEPILIGSALICTIQLLILLQKAAKTIAKKLLHIIMYYWVTLLVHQAFIRKRKKGV